MSLLLSSRFSCSPDRLPLSGLYGNLVYALLMATTLKLSRKVLVHDFARHVLVDETPGHHQHVGIVVLTDEVGYLGYPAQTGTDALVFVERHVDAFARAADGYARINLALLDATRQCMAEIAIVARSLAVGSVVLVGQTLLVEILLYELF